MNFSSERAHCFSGLISDAWYWKLIWEPACHRSEHATATQWKGVVALAGGCDLSHLGSLWFCGRIYKENPMAQSHTLAHLWSLCVLVPGCSHVLLVAAWAYQ